MINNHSKRYHNQAMKNLTSAGITDVTMLRQLMDVLIDPSELTELFGVERTLIDEMLDTEDLLSLEGIGYRYIELLHKTGITTISELRTCDPFELRERMAHASQAYSLGRVPNRITIEHWIEQAQAFKANADG